MVSRFFRGGALLKLSGIGWCLVLIVLMATGTVTTARIGEMTWGAAHDVWSASIALSKINLGLSGELGYHEVEQAIANEITSTKSVWNAVDDRSRALLQDPKAITRAFQAGAAVTLSAISVPATKAGYLVDWCEDLGYADFYDVAFRLFGFDAFSTHWLYMSILTASLLLFVGAFADENAAIASLVLAVSALFLMANSSIFSESVPSFAANRFLSTLVVIPLLHILHSIVRLHALRWREAGLVAAQALLLTWVVATRSSGEWTFIAIIIGLGAVITMRGTFSDKSLFSRVRAIPYIGRIGTVAAIVLVMTVSANVIRSRQIDERYFWDDNLPHHLFWHGAWIALPLHPDWLTVKPYSDLPDYRSDGVGFLWFQHRMTEMGQPFLSDNSPRFYRVRLYEKMIRDALLSFLFQHPIYGLELYAYYKPLALIHDFKQLFSSIRVLAWGLVGVSTILAIALLSARKRRPYRELLALYGVAWVCSLSPVIWAYPAAYADADQIDMTLFLAPALVACSIAIGVQLIVGSPSCSAKAGNEVDLNP